jgi:hypothetical protein
MEHAREHPRKEYELAVARHEDASLIGKVGLRLQDGAPETAELSFALRRDCWRQDTSWRS